MTTLSATLKQLGLSQSALARLVGTVPGTVNRWCQGVRGEPYWLPSWLAMYGMLTEEQQKILWQNHKIPLDGNPKTSYI